MDELQTEATQTTPRTVLCIEDEPFIADLYKRALEKGNYKVDVVLDGITGLEKAKTNQYDIILLDIVIPQMMGLDVLNELTKLKELKSKIVIATNLEQDDETRHKVEQQADAYLIKAEITPSELTEFLNKIDV